ncbi:MAG: succinate dehydrogenase cytochrome b subunit [Chlorobi bacterium]|nr:succinate dehydrogenase cytochrome b subunit [Chlorobiota bacterium]
MNKLLQYSSIASKVAMALAGLFLVTFLGVHLGINLLLLKADGGRSFSEAAEFMGTNPLIRIFEIVLMAGFLIHIFIGFLVSGKNRASRPAGYEVGNRTETSFLSKYMMHSGVVVLLFLALHFSDYYFVKIGIVSPPEGIDAHDFYAMTLHLFSSTWYALFYMFSFIPLGFHLNHAIQSAFQTMGWNHSRYMDAVKVTGTIYSVAISLGFMVIPLYFLLFR